MNTEYEYTGNAMGTEYSISIISSSEIQASTAAQKAISDIHKYEERFSRFLPSSELSKLNQLRTTVVSKLFIELTKEMLKLFRITGGIFNPLLQIKAFGYDRNFSEIKSEIYATENVAYDMDFSKTIIDEENSSITLVNDQRMDLGGFLKGYLAEVLCKQIMNSSEKISGAIVNLGGDIHTQGTDAQGDTFIFSIFNPVTNRDDITLSLYNQSLATSGTYKRNWVRRGVTMHHILNSSGKSNPQSDIVSASVIDKNGGAAEAYAKVFLSLGKKGLEVLPKQSMSYVLIKSDGKVIQNIL